MPEGGCVYSPIRFEAPLGVRPFVEPLRLPVAEGGIEVLAVRLVLPSPGVTWEKLDVGVEGNTSDIFFLFTKATVYTEGPQ